MTLLKNYKPVKQLGNGTTKNFSFTFGMLDEKYSVVILENVSTGVQTKKVLNTDYTVNITSGTEGGTVSFLTAPTANDYVIIGRTTPSTQEIPLSTSSGFQAQTVMNMMDKLTAEIQEFSELSDRLLKFSLGSTITSGKLPTPVDNRALVWDGINGDIKNSDFTTEDINNAETYASSASASATSASTSATNASISAANAQAAAGSLAAIVPASGDESKFLQVATPYSNGYVKLTPTQVKDVIEPDEVDFGNFSGSKTFSVDTVHKGNVIGDCTLNVPTDATNKFRNIIFDFNKQPGRAITLPTNIDWVNGTPTFVGSPDMTLNIATISNMILNFPATASQYADFANVAFNNLGSQTWEIILNFTPTQIGVLQYLLNNSLNGYAPLIGINASNHFIIYLSSNNTSYDIANGTSGTYTVANSTNMFVKIAFTGTQYILSTSTDYNITTGTGTWTSDITVTSSLTVNASTLTGLLRLGQAVATPTVNNFKGTVDLTKSSVKIAGGINLLAIPINKYLNRIALDTNNGGTRYKGYYSQVSP